MIKSISKVIDRIDRRTGLHRIRRLLLTEEIKACLGPRNWQHQKLKMLKKLEKPKKLKMPESPSGDVKAWHDTVSSRTDIRTPENTDGEKNTKKSQITYKNVQKNITSLTLLWLSLSILPSS